MTTHEILLNAKQAAREMQSASPEARTAALNEMAMALEESKAAILAENEVDLARAQGVISDVMLDRLRLTGSRIAGMAQGLRDVAALPDPVGRVLDSHTRPDGLNIKKVSVPLGVIGIIYESRPNVTGDAAALCVKSGNACVLRCGKEAHKSAAAIVAALQTGLEKAGLPRLSVQLIEDTSRASANEMMTANGLIDLLIPRGGKGLIQACVQNATVPCIETGTGICHIYVDREADFDKALRVIENAKTSRPSVCNAAEVCLVDRAVAAEFVPLLEKRLHECRTPVELRMDGACLAFAKESRAAGEADFDTEFLDYILAVGAVDGVDGAIAHIALHSTGHSEAIITENPDTAGLFTAQVDSAAVYVNASTRFTDGGEFGLGCEMGISTQKLHARGPMGLCEMTTYKYIVTGSGHIR